MAAARPDASLAVDSTRLGSLKAAAARDPAGQAKAAAQQFESVFANLLIKSMREAMPKSSMGGESSKLFEGMLDQQHAQAIASRGGLGLAPVIEKQLLRHINATTPREGAAMPPAALNQVAQRGIARYEIVQKTSVDAMKPLPQREGAAPAQPEGFVAKLKEHAVSAARAIGVPTAFVLGQAALESGWGKREIGADQGVKSHNLFGIKAGANWKGETVEIPTTEYVDGVAKTVKAKFRAYASYGEAFADYAKLITGSSRYKAATTAGDDAVAFAQGLQRGGYATDPKYAEKLAKTIERAGRVG